MMSLLAHRTVVDKQYPPREAYERLIDKSDDTHQHWLWEGDFYEDPFSRTPVFFWKPPGSTRTGKYVVARLLWVEANPGEYKHLVLRNTCGVYACLNPAHWENPHREHAWTLPDGSDVELVHTVYRAPLKDPDDGSFDGFEERERVHVRVRGARYTMCSATLTSNFNMHKVTVLTERVAITCEKCIKEWRTLGRPLEELP